VKDELGAFSPPTYPRTVEVKAEEVAHRASTKPDAAARKAAEGDERSLPFDLASQVPHDVDGRLAACDGQPPAFTRHHAGREAAARELTPRDGVRSRAGVRPRYRSTWSSTTVPTSTGSFTPRGGVGSLRREARLAAGPPRGRSRAAGGPGHQPRPGQATQRRLERSPPSTPSSLRAGRVARGHATAALPPSGRGAGSSEPTAGHVAEPRRPRSPRRSRGSVSRRSGSRGSDPGARAARKCAATGHEMSDQDVYKQTI